MIDAGKIVREARVASEPEALLQVLTNTLYRIKRVGLEAGDRSKEWCAASDCEAPATMTNSKNCYVGRALADIPSDVINAARRMTWPR